MKHPCSPHLACGNPGGRYLAGVSGTQLFINTQIAIRTDPKQRMRRVIKTCVLASFGMLPWTIEMHLCDELIHTDGLKIVQAPTALVN